jgi:16S rRNA (cytidine1402-2'-O)-methyltransferase
VLYIVATPIGNLSDISLRALDVLRQVDFVACEDTRKTGLLLKRFGVEARLLSFHEHNEIQMGHTIIRHVQGGKSVALVSDAGTPGVSDPGFSLIRRAIQAEIEPTVIPGPTALIIALVLSGLPTHSFTFRGFPPREPGRRRRFLEVDKASPHSLIFYESPHRLRGFLEDALAVYGDRRGALANDLTKKFEGVLRGNLSRLIQMIEESAPRGEFTIVISGLPSHRGSRRTRSDGRLAS